MKKMTYCKKAAIDLERIRELILKSKESAEKQQKSEYLERDLDFIEQAESVLVSCEAEKLQQLIDEMRGLSHYFGSYSLSIEQLDVLLDDFYKKVQKAILALRN